MKETFKAWVAGLMDGEGCITFICNPRTKRPHAPNVSITNTHRGCLKLIDSAWSGGKTFSRQDVKGRKRCWRLQFTGWENIERFLSDILPYLVIKRQQAEILLRIRNVRRDRGLGRIGGYCKIRKYTNRERGLVFKLRALNASVLKGGKAITLGKRHK